MPILGYFSIGFLHAIKVCTVVKQQLSKIKFVSSTFKLIGGRLDTQSTPSPPGSAPVRGEKRGGKKGVRLSMIYIIGSLATAWLWLNRKKVVAAFSYTTVAGVDLGIERGGAEVKCTCTQENFTFSHAHFAITVYITHLM